MGELSRRLENMAASKSVGFISQLNNSLKRWAFRASGYNQYGLYHDDCLHVDADVKEAISRLPQREQDDRHWRMQVAFQLSVQKSILPKEEWLTYEEDREKGRYLQPFLAEVIKENEEREEWNKIKKIVKKDVTYSHSLLKLLKRTKNVKNGTRNRLIIILAVIYIYCTFVLFIRN